jgi:diguanylate cyclase (GGDEF)-like protein
MTRQELVFRAALTRFALGVFAVALMPVLYPATASSRWFYAAYMGVAAVEQVLIRKQIGGMARSFLAGLIDLVVVTYTVHRLGSVATTLACFYFFASKANALVVGLRVGATLSLLNGVAYGAVVWAEHTRVLPFAPDVPDVARYGPPTTEQALTAIFLISMLMVCSTAVVGLLVHALRQREASLLLANEKLVVLSQRDPLTGLYNRRYLFERIELELERVRRGRELALLMIDLDHFKRVNDTQGHLRGDLLLKEIGVALAATTRVTDVVGRYGGDEFLVVLPDADAEQAGAVAERAAKSAREVGERFDAELPVTASVGIAVARADDTLASLVRRADDLEWKAKERGGDRVVA